MGDAQAAIEVVEVKEGLSVAVVVEEEGPEDG